MYLVVCVDHFTRAFLECLSFSVHDSCGFNKTAGGKGQSIHIIKLQIPKNAELRLSWEWTIILRLAFVLNPKWLVGWFLVELEKYSNF